MIEYSHFDDYYIFGFIKEGACSISIDFKDYNLISGDMVILNPGQVHQLITSDIIKAYILFVDETFIKDTYKSIIDEYALSLYPFSGSNEVLSDISQLLFILAQRFNVSNKIIIQHLALAVVGMMVESLKSTVQSPTKRSRLVEITLLFKELLENNISSNRSPAFYASELYLSSVYLNEAIKETTGVSASKYIQNEIMLRAKRLLMHTSLNIQEIASKLGFDDSAYFSRLFSKIVGVNPSIFRSKYLK